VGVVTHDIMLV